MMTHPDDDEAGHGREGALAALEEVAAGPEMMKQFGIPAAAFRTRTTSSL